MRRLKSKRVSNLVPLLSRFSPTEKIVMCHCINIMRHSRGETEVHLGTLPFIPLKEAIGVMTGFAASGSALPGMDSTQAVLRLHKQIAAKLSSDEAALFSGASAFVRFNMELDDRKVYKDFGPHPERGKPLPILPKEKVTVGVKWSLPKKAYLADKDVLVSPCVTLTKRAPGIWTVEVLAKCQYTVEQWLIDRCR